MQIQELQPGFNLLHKILLVALLGVFLSSLIIDQLQPIPLITTLIAYSVLGCERISLFTYKIVIITMLTFIGLFISQILHDASDENNKSIILPGKLLNPTNRLIIVSVYILLMIYTIILSWRCYQRTKCSIHDNSKLVYTGVKLEASCLIYLFFNMKQSIEFTAINSERINKYSC